MEELSRTSPQPYVASGTGFLPVTSRSGRIVAWAKIDPEALDRLFSKPWRLTSRGYVGRCERRDGRRVTILLAREVMGISTGGPRVIHRNGDKLDCRSRNLRWSRRWLTQRLERDRDMAAV